MDEAKLLRVNDQVTTSTEYDVNSHYYVQLSKNLSDKYEVTNEGNHSNEYNSDRVYGIRYF